MDAASTRTTPSENRPPIGGFVALFFAPALLCAFAPNFTVLLIFRTLQGLFMPGLTSVAIAYVNEEFEGKWRGLAMGIYVSGQTLGGLFARVGSATLTDLVNWRIALMAFVLPTLIAALVMWRFLPENRGRRRSQSELHGLQLDTAFLHHTLRDMWQHLHNRRLVGAFIIGFTLFFGFIGVFTYLPFYLSGPLFRLPTLSLGLVYLLWITGVFSPVAGTLAGRIGTRKAIACTGGLAVVGLLITLIPVLPIVIIGLALLTLGMFSTMPATNLYLGEQATTAKGTAASMYLSLYYFGGSFGAVVPGIALLWAGWPGVVLICLCMMLIALTADALLCR